MPKLSLEDFERQEREGAREALRDYGFDPDHLTPEDVQGSRKLYLLGILAGAFEPAAESLETFVLEAEKDPVLWTEISDEAREACRKRAQLVAYLFMGNEWGLSAEDMKVAQALVDLYGSVEDTVHVLLSTSPSLSKAELLAGKQTPPSDAERLWVDEYAAQVAMVKPKDWEWTVEEVDKFFHDGQPFTCARMIAYSQAYIEGVKDVNEVKDTTFSRTLN